MDVRPEIEKTNIRSGPDPVNRPAVTGSHWQAR
jgi:hypothetical protein